jgi:purine-binding chemotaxis protein CheW
MKTSLQERPATSSSAARGPAAVPREYLSFRLGKEEYGIDILRVQEIRRHEAPTQLANAPAFVKGVVNLRGVIVPIIDLRLKLGFEAAAYDDSTVVIVLNMPDRVIGVVVDSVSDVLELSAESIKPPPGMSTSVHTDYIIGLGCIESGETKRMLILTDIDALMSADASRFVELDMASLDV